MYKYFLMINNLYLHNLMVRITDFHSVSASSNLAEGRLF